MPTPAPPVMLCGATGTTRSTEPDTQLADTPQILLAHRLKALKLPTFRRENIVAVGNSCTGKSHIAPGLGLAAYRKELSVGFITAAALRQGAPKK